MSANSVSGIQQLVEEYSNGCTLQEISRRISESAGTMEEEWRNNKQKKLEQAEQVAKALQAALAQGDTSENAEYSEALSELQQIRGTIAIYDEKLQALCDLENEKRYEPIGMVLLYSTVCIEDENKSKYIFKIYPKGVSDLSRGIVSRDRAIIKAAWKCKVGDTFQAWNKGTNTNVAYTVKEIW